MLQLLNFVDVGMLHDYMHCDDDDDIGFSQTILFTAHLQLLLHEIEYGHTITFATIVSRIDILIFFLSLGCGRIWARQNEMLIN